MLTLTYLDPNRFADISTGELKIEENSLSYIAKKVAVDAHSLQEELIHFACCYKNGDLAVWNEVEGDFAQETTEHYEEEEGDEYELDEDEEGEHSSAHESEREKKKCKNIDCGKCMPCIFKFLKRYNLHSAA